MLAIGLGSPKGTVDAWVISFTLLAAETVMRLFKGTPTGAMIPRAAKVDVAAKVDAGVRESGCWPGS